MHLSVKGLSIKPEHLVVDGNYFLPYLKIPHKTVVKGDNTYMNIAAASILAKTYRDEWMEKLHKNIQNTIGPAIKGMERRLTWKL